MLSNKDCMKKRVLDTFLRPNFFDSQLLFWKSNFILETPKRFYKILEYEVSLGSQKIVAKS